MTLDPRAVARVLGGNVIGRNVVAPGSFSDKNVSASSTSSVGRSISTTRKKLDRRSLIIRTLEGRIRQCAGESGLS